VSSAESSGGGLLGTVIRGAGLAGGGYALAQALTLLAYLVLARLIAPAHFGEFAAAAIVVNAGMLFAESGMLAALIHRRDRLEEAANTAVVATTLAGILLGLVALAASPLIGFFFDSDRVGAVAASLAGLMPLRALPIVPEALLQRRFSFLRRVVSEPAAVIAFGAVAIIAASNGLGVWALVLGYYASAITDALLTWTLVRWRPHPSQASFQVWRELVGYGRHVMTATVILRVGSEVPNAILGRWVGSGPLGQFRYADRIATTPFAAILATASWVLFPALAHISDQRKRFRDAYLRAMRTILALAVPLGLSLLPLGVPIAVLVFGSEWRGAGEAAMALCLYTGAASWISVATEAFKAAGRPELLTRTHLLTVLVGSACMVALLPFELVGVAAGVSVGMVAGALYATAASVHALEVGWHQQLACVWPAALASIAMVAVLFGAEAVIDAEGHGTAVGLALLAGEAAVGAAVYGLVVLTLDPGLRAELARIRARGAPEAGGPGDPPLPLEEPYEARPGSS